jgi:hypothetical protein
MNIKSEIQKAREAYDAETSQVTKAYLHGFLCGLVYFEPEIKRLRKAIEDHINSPELSIEYRACDRKLWEVLE